jgi:hypothetical protein
MLESQCGSQLKASHYRDIIRHQHRRHNSSLKLLHMLKSREPCRKASTEKFSAGIQVHIRTKSGMGDIFMLPFESLTTRTERIILNHR